MFLCVLSAVVVCVIDVCFRRLLTCDICTFGRFVFVVVGVLDLVQLYSSF